MSTKTNNPTVQLIENVIVLEVDNILQGWPAYIINFTPQDTNPHKLILHLKNPSKSVTMDSDDEDRDPTAPPSEYNTAKLTTNIKARVFVPKPRYNGSNPLNESADESESSDDEKTPLTVVNAILVNLSSVPKDTIPMKCKAFHDANWPPRQPRTFQKISQNSSIASYEAFMAFPAAVKCMEDSCGGPDGEKIDMGEHNTKN
ncbi:hypothetical protein EDC04DRAFT_2598383 [Pisolithus marmoratus]|nr:hypothetical protein EDC04DRAFT_2598383 [Pisolithus marmoratus]